MNWALADRSLSSSLRSLLMALSSNFARLFCLDRQQFYLFIYCFILFFKKPQMYLFPALILCSVARYINKAAVSRRFVCRREGGGASERRCLRHWEERNVHKALWRVVNMFIWDRCHCSSFSFNRLIDLLLITQQFWFKNRLRLQSICSISILEYNPTKPRSIHSPGLGATWMGLAPIP